MWSYAKFLVGARTLIKKIARFYSRCARRNLDVGIFIE